MAELCKFCISVQERLLADGDSSQVVCTHQHVDQTDGVEETSKQQTKKRKRTNNFILPNEFEAEVVKNKRKNAIKWSTLQVDAIFKIETIKKIDVTKDGERTTSRIAELKNEVGEVTIVWLPDIVDKELANIEDFEKKRVYIRSYGLKLNKKGTRKYFNFDIVKQ